MSTKECSKEEKNQSPGNGQNLLSKDPMLAKVMPRPKRRRRRRRPKYKNLMYRFDDNVRRDISYIQAMSSASSGADAVRMAIRRFAQMVRYAERDYEIHAVNLETSKTVLIDVPGNQMPDKFDEESDEA